MRILIAGATGLVGQGVLQACLEDPGVAAVVALGRRPTECIDPKLSELVVADFAELGAVEDQLQPFDACLYCAGAPPLGTPEGEYRRVTLDLTLHVARTMARLNPGMTFVYVSGAHSDPDSAFMPLRVKGETESALAALPIRTIMLRTGGVRPVDGVHSPHAMMETLYTLADPLMRLGVHLMPGQMTTTTRVGQAMLALLRQDDPPGIVENDEINRIAAEAP
ncbi:NAD-dependent epimerase/dehydratase family protein [Luteimonas vadosa]|uniref:Epimerase n=1 Tax=Luteimonas vadosa TaxID=1165507 RepID=A0ABP9E6H5_9GAMM